MSSFISLPTNYPWLKLQTVLMMCTVGQIRAKCYCVFECSSWEFFNGTICSLMCWKFVFQILMSLSHCKDTQGKCLLQGVDILKRCSSYMRVLLYTTKRSLVKLNIKHRMFCKKPINYKMLTKFFLDVIAWLYGEGGNSHILVYRMCDFYGTQFRLENKCFWAIYFSL